MRLVAHALHEIQRAARGWQHDRLGAAGAEELLALLGQARQRQIVQAELVEDLAGGADLSATAVDDDEVRQPPAQLFRGPLGGPQGMAESASQDLLVNGEVVRPFS